MHYLDGLDTVRSLNLTTPELIFLVTSARILCKPTSYGKLTKRTLVSMCTYIGQFRLTERKCGIKIKPLYRKIRRLGIFSLACLDFWSKVYNLSKNSYKDEEAYVKTLQGGNGERLVYDLAKVWMTHKDQIDAGRLSHYIANHPCSLMGRVITQSLDYYEDVYPEAFVDVFVELQPRAFRCLA